MRTIPVPLKGNAYTIVVGHRILAQLGSYLKKLRLGQDAVIITHPKIQKYHGRPLVDGLKKGGFSVTTFEVPEGEESKSTKQAFGLMERIARYDVSRKIFIIAFGGGVIGDLAGYVAAVYKRGIPYVQVPTTFLAQIDSAIGGKVAVDLSVGKNLVGAFYQPRLVFNDVALLATLDQRQIRNGLAEAVKYGVIADQGLFDYIAENYRGLLNHERRVLTNVILRCSRIKTRVIVRDEKETKGIRTILNFGHTVGHAIEAAGRYRLYQHGEAVALGMQVAAAISVQMGLLSSSEALRLTKVLSCIGFPPKIKQVRLADIMRVMKHDKKFRAGQNRFVLVRAIGKVKVVEGVPEKIIRRAIAQYMPT